jgi:hypothetical protein
VSITAIAKNEIEMNLPNICLAFPLFEAGILPHFSRVLWDDKPGALNSIVVLLAWLM